MKKWMSTLITLLFCFAAGIIHAQIRPRSLVDFTGGTPLRGIPDSSVTDIGGSGATILPGNMPIHHLYTNNAPYPLYVTYSASYGGHATNGMSIGVIVNGQQTLTQSGDTGQWLSTNFIVPPGASFCFVNSRTALSCGSGYNAAAERHIPNIETSNKWTNSGFVHLRTTVQVTALASNATWQDTGIVFQEYISTRSYTIITTQDPVENCENFSIQYTVNQRNNVTGVTSAAVLPYQVGVSSSCPAPF